MKTVIRPPKSHWKELAVRPLIDSRQLVGKVRSILDDVKTSGENAVRDYCLKFDAYDPSPMEIPAMEFRSAEEVLGEKLKLAIRRAARNIELFHRNQLVELPIVYISRSIQCWQKDIPIERLGFYIPGGTAPLFSTVLMLGIPAKIAGCQDVIMCTPADSSGRIHPAILYAANICGIKKVFRIGGVQAIAAMTYGTKEIRPVDKIFGPGNQYVTLAKQLVSEEGIAIDMPAGPSELLLIADETADPAFVAADLLSQAEHGADSQVVLTCMSLTFASRVKEELMLQVEELPRKDIALQSLINSRIIVLESLSEMMEFSNFYAPEHLIMCVKEARKLSEDVRNAGSVFIGNYTPESAGDYASGTNHTLPTNGYARSFSALNLQSFMKTIQFQEIQADGLAELGPDVIEMAEAEGLQAHAQAVRMRMMKGE